MSTDEKFPPTQKATVENPHTHDHGDDQAPQGGLSRRDFIKSGAAGVAAGALAGYGLAGFSLSASAQPGGYGPGAPTISQGNRIVLKDAIVLTMDPNVGDFEKADVLIEGKKIVAVGPNLGAAGQVIDCSGTIVMPGFVTTHHHQYETIQRSIIPDGILRGDWPQEAYGSVVQNIWTAGRIQTPPPLGSPPGTPPGPTIWDLGRPPYDPEDVYISELVASLSQITEGVTCGVDTSQASHTPEYTDAMIQGLIDSGRRTVYDYSGGTNRSAPDTPRAPDLPHQPYEHPGRSGNTSFGVGRLATTYFNSEDQLVTLGLNAGPTSVIDPKTGEEQPYTGWQLAREFGALINNHNVGSPQTVIDAAADPRNGTDWSDVTLVHCVRWQDNPLAQISHSHLGYPNPATSQAWEIFSDRGGHSSIANLIEMQMRHGMPPFQFALNYGILPSLSPDVDTNMTTDPFSLMRGAFCLQRALANDLAFPPVADATINNSSNPGSLPIPQLVTSRQVIEMVTIAGAASCRLLHKIGTLTPGKEADIVVLDARNINITPMNNVPGTIVTMLNPRHVRHVLIAGKIVYRDGKLVGWNIDKLLKDVENSRERVLRRINGPAVIGSLPPGNNSPSNPYRPNFLGSCCFEGQNTEAPFYQLRP
jgi:cytosine/adenosine deaminase-related metal-dependent hydrolase